MTAEAAETQLQEARTQRVLAAIGVGREDYCPQPFGLYRHQDVTGVSGTGAVAYGVQFADRTVVIRWQGETPSTVIWESLEAAMRVHGHDGKTQVVWLMAPFSEMGLAEEEAAAAGRERIAAAIEALAANYPEDVFPPDSDTRDAIGGTAMRHAYRNMARTVREMPGSEEENRDA
jgi:hypothetical protein